jgi:hypothetical protein
MQHPGPVARAVFSADGRLVLSTGRRDLATGTPDDTARLWDARTGARIAPPFPHQTGIEHAALSRDAVRLTTVLGNQVLIWPLTPEERPVDLLLRAAQATSSRQIDAGGGEVMLDPASVRDAIAQSGGR